MNFLLNFCLISFLFSFQKTTLYITFDNGPFIDNRSFTDIISEKEIPLTFFILGQNIKEDNLSTLVENPFIELANNSYSLSNLSKKKHEESDDEIFKDIQKNKAFLKLNHNITRIPDRNIWVLSKERYRSDINLSYELLRRFYDHKYKIFGWDIELRMNANGKQSNYKQIHKNIEKLKNSDLLFTKNHIVLRLNKRVFQSEAGRNAFNNFIDKIKLNAQYKLAFLKDYP